MPRYVEIGHRIRDGMAVYPGLPAPSIRAHRSHAETRSSYGGQAEFEFSRVDMVGNVGTYLDSPYHRFRDGDDIAALPLQRLVDVDVVVVDAPAQAGPVEVDAGDVRGTAVLFRTGWSRRWGGDSYWEPGPYLGERMLAALVQQDPALVGVDFWNIDDTDDLARPAHTRLLAAGIPVIEHLCNLDDVPATGARLWALPLGLEGVASVAVRPIAVCPDGP